MDRSAVPAPLAGHARFHLPPLPEHVREQRAARRRISERRRKAAHRHTPTRMAA